MSIRKNAALIFATLSTLAITLLVVLAPSPLPPAARQFETQCRMQSAYNRLYNCHCLARRHAPPETIAATIRRTGAQCFEEGTVRETALQSCRAYREQTYTRPDCSCAARESVKVLRRGPHPLPPFATIPAAIRQKCGL